MDTLNKHTVFKLWTERCILGNIKAMMEIVTATLERHTICVVFPQKNYYFALYYKTFLTEI